MVIIIIINALNGNYPCGWKVDVEAKEQNRINNLICAMNFFDDYMYL